MGIIGNLDSTHNIDINLIKDSTLLALELTLVVVLFKEGIHLNLKNFYDHIFSILLIAIIGTIFTTILVGFSLIALIPINSDQVLYLFLLAAIFAPSDPSATFSVLRGGTTRIKEKVETILGGEAALNDIIAILLVVIILIPALTEEGESLTFHFSIHVLFNAVWQSLGGIVFGLLIGMLALLFIHIISSSIEESLLSLTAVLILFSVGTLLHVSTAIAALIAGIVFGNPDIFKLKVDLVNKQIDAFWDYISFVFEMLAFLFIGTALSLTIFIEEPIITIFALIISIIVIGGRMIGICLTTAPLQLNERFKKEFNNKERIFIGFAGMKGLTTGVLAMIAFIELSKFSKLMAIAEIILYSSILVIIFTGIIHAVLLKKLAKKTDVLDNFKIDELDLIKGNKLVLEASLAFIEEDIKNNKIQLRDLKNISIPLREELYSIREHIARMRSEERKDLKSLQLGLKLNETAQNAILASRENKSIKETTYQAILSDLLAEKHNIELYINNIEAEDKSDTSKEINVIAEDLDVIEEAIALLESNQDQDYRIEALKKIRTKIREFKDLNSKLT